MEKELYNDGWFYMESYTFISLMRDNVLLYNTLDGSFVKSKDTTIVQIISELQKENNCGVMLINSELQANQSVRFFLSLIREKFMGDLIPLSLSSRKPIQLYPILNLQSDIRKIKNNKYSIENDASLYVDHIVFYINTSCSRNCSFCNIAYKQTTMCSRTIMEGNLSVNSIKYIVDSALNKNLKTITISGGNIFYYKDIEALSNYLKSTNILVEWVCFYENIIESKLHFLQSENFIFRVVFDSSICKCDINNMFSNLKLMNIRTFMDILIWNEDDYYTIQLIIDKREILKDAIIKLLFHEQNNEFIEKYSYWNEDDILSDVISMQDIFSHQVLNKYNFGQLSIFPNGDVYANVNFSLLGNINKSSIFDLAHTEFVSGNSWLKIRDQKPCNQCIYQWLCPPPSNYEIVIGKPNLCHVNL
jgi:pseudo-rSAM protein